jgi:hypothetical protein
MQDSIKIVIGESLDNIKNADWEVLHCSPGTHFLEGTCRSDITCTRVTEPDALDYDTSDDYEKAMEKYTGKKSLVPNKSLIGNDKYMEELSKAYDQFLNPTMTCVGGGGAKQAPTKPCECGVESVGGGLHSSWCPKYEVI